MMTDVILPEGEYSNTLDDVVALLEEADGPRREASMH